MNRTKVKFALDIIELCCGIFLLTSDELQWMGIIFTVGSLFGIYDGYKKLWQK